MPKVNCCVPNCVATKKRTPHLNFYQLPLDETRRKRWKILIRNERLRFDSKWTSVCSLHFSGGRKSYLNKDPSVFPWSAEWPSVIRNYNRSIQFSPHQTPKTTKKTGILKPLPLNTPKHSATQRSLDRCQTRPARRRRVLFKEPLEEHCDAGSIQESGADGMKCDSPNSLAESPTSEKFTDRAHQMETGCVSPEVVLGRPYYPETHLLLKDDLQGLLDDIMSALEKDDRFNDIGSLKALLRIVIKLLKNIKEEFDVVAGLRDWDRFLLRRFEGSDDDIKFWTGFYSHDALMAFYKNLLEPKVGEIKYWGASNSDDKDKTHTKAGPRRKLEPIDEMFMTLIKLEQGSANLDLAERFNVSDSHVSRIFTTWVKFMHTVLSAIDPWMSRRKVQKFMPKCFQELYKDVRVIIDCTEIPLQRPSDFESQSATYSSYKQCNTLKGLVGISPSGIPTFVSNLFEGSISDNQITFESGLVKQCQKGDAVMADRGFTCREAMAKQGVRLVIPHFLGSNDQLDLLRITESVAIARVRIHVERAMGRIKQWHILSRTLPVTYWNCANDMFQLCTKLVLF